MNDFQLLETVGVIIIIGLQIIIFWRTKAGISVFKNIFPEEEDLQIFRPAIKRTQLKLHPRDILANLENEVNENASATVDPGTRFGDDLFNSSSEIRPADEMEEKQQVDLIRVSKGGNDITKRIIYSINTYLLRNRGVASDFHIIKDVVERNCDAREDDINQTISLPLYLGLLGTFLGIVLGLFMISGVDYASDPAALNNAISLLLNGVKIAMIASFTGLGLTILNTGFFFKGAKAVLEEKKNKFYTFIQTELLPLLNQNINSTLYSLQNNLHKFNEEFQGNLGLLSNVMGKNYNALIAQEKILTTLEKLDITEFAKANVKILHELQYSTDKFTEFNQYLFSMTELLSHTKMVGIKLNELMERSNNFSELGQKIVQAFDENMKLQKFLQDHYSSLGESRQLISRSVVEVGQVVGESLDQLKIFTQEKISEVHKIALKEIDIMQSEYSDRWKKLDNLTLLESLNNNVSDLKLSSASQSERLKNELAEVKEMISSLDSIAKKMSSKKSVFKKTWQWLKQKA